MVFKVVDMRLTQHIRLHTTTYHLLLLMSQEVRESLHCASGTQGQSPLALIAAQLLRECKQRNCCDKIHGRHHVASHPGALCTCQWAGVQRLQWLLKGGGGCIWVVGDFTPKWARPLHVQKLLDSLLFAWVATGTEQLYAAGVHEWCWAHNYLWDLSITAATH